MVISRKSIREFFSWDYHFTSHGRRGRLHYFITGLFWGLMVGLLGEVFEKIGFAPRWADFFSSLMLLYPSYCNTAKRFHDLNKSRNWAIALQIMGFLVSFCFWFIHYVEVGFVILFVCFLLSVYLLFFRGTKGKNRFGPDPLLKTI